MKRLLPWLPAVLVLLGALLYELSTPAFERQARERRDICERHLPGDKAMCRRMYERDLQGRRAGHAVPPVRRVPG